MKNLSPAAQGETRTDQHLNGEDFQKPPGDDNNTLYERALIDNHISVPADDENIFDESCPFCAIAKDKKKAVTDVYPGPWDPYVVVLQPIDPATEGHILVIPRTHVSDSTHAEIFATIAFWASKVAKARYPGEHVNFNFNQGQFAGQTVDHAHFHVVPRRKDDQLPQFWDGQEKGHYNTAGKAEHPEHVKPTYLRKVGIS
jgi:histidine triad (HIT) family protein